MKRKNKVLASPFIEDEVKEVV